MQTKNNSHKIKLIVLATVPAVLLAISILIVPQKVKGAPGDIYLKNVGSIVVNFTATGSYTTPYTLSTPLDLCNGDKVLAIQESAQRTNSGGDWMGHGFNVFGGNHLDFAYFNAWGPGNGFCYSYDNGNGTPIDGQGTVHPCGDDSLFTGGPAPKVNSSSFWNTPLLDGQLITDATMQGNNQNGAGVLSIQLEAMCIESAPTSTNTPTLTGTPSGDHIYYVEGGDNTAISHSVEPDQIGYTTVTADNQIVPPKCGDGDEWLSTIGTFEYAVTIPWENVALSVGFPGLNSANLINGGGAGSASWGLRKNNSITAGLDGTELYNGDTVSNDWSGNWDGFDGLTVSGSNDKKSEWQVTAIVSKTWCYGNHEPPKEECGVDRLCDGGQEQFPRSAYWDQENTGMVQGKVDLQPYWFIRINPDQVNEYQAFQWRQTNGYPACGSGFHGVGQSDAWAGVGSPISQQFEWTGGTMYYKFRAKGIYSPYFPYSGPQSHATVEIIDSSGQLTYLAEDIELTGDWQLFTGNISLSAGTYRFILDNLDILNFSAYPQTIVYYDDVAIGHYPQLEGCTDDNSSGFPTATPTNPPIGAPSPTPPLDTPEPLLLINCGYEWGQNGWWLSPSSYIGLAGGPTGPQHLVTSGSNPGGVQLVRVDRSDNVYLSAWVKGPARIEMVNVSTGAVILLYAGTTSDWTQIFKTAYIPAGAYKYQLSTLEFLSKAYFDGAVLAYNQYDTWSTCALTPTPGPTAALTATPTPPTTPTPSRTSTLATSTPWWLVTPTTNPAYTAWAQTMTAQAETQKAIWTQQALTLTPNLAATLTANAETATHEAQETIEFIGTSTAQGTPQIGYGTLVAGSGTPGTYVAPHECDNFYVWMSGKCVPSLTQPPPSEDAECIKPDSFWDFVGWGGYYVCKILSFFSWGPDNQAQVQQLGSGLENYEPFGTISDIQAGAGVIQTQVSYYAFSLTSLPGISGNPSTYNFTNAGSNPNTFWGGGSINLRGSGPSYSTSCASTITSAVGTRLGASMCFIYDILRQNNLMPWVQAFINLSCLITMVIYIRNKVIDLFLV